LLIANRLSTSLIWMAIQRLESLITNP